MAYQYLGWMLHFRKVPEIKELCIGVIVIVESGKDQLKITDTSLGIYFAKHNICIVVAVVGVRRDYILSYDGCNCCIGVVLWSEEATFTCT